MRIFFQTELFTAASILGCATMLGQTQPQHVNRVKPPAGVPTLPSTQATAALPEAPSTPAQRSPQHAVVSYTQGQLAVTADNSSLNQILREVGRLTGLKISGGVADERVFGSYGPAPAPVILAALLDGTGSNMLLLQSSTDAPGELVLTPRHGGPTPPNPNAPAMDDSNDRNVLPQQMGGRQLQPQAPPPPQQPPQQQPQQDTRIQDTLPESQPPTAAPAAGTDPTQQLSPNGVKTPQQIYEQLLKMQQQQPSPR